MRGRQILLEPLGPRPVEDLTSAGFALLYHDEGCRYFPAQLPFDYLTLRDCQCDPFGVQEWETKRTLLRHLKHGIVQQDELWVNKEDAVMRLEDMSLRYLRNLKGFLEARAGRFRSRWYWGSFGGGASGAPEGPDDEEAALPPVEWLRRQPLLLKVDELIAAGNDGPID